MVYPELGEAVLMRFAESLSHLAVIEQKPVLDGRFMSLILAPKKEK